MLTAAFQEKTLSLLGFGAMRLPTLPDGEIDKEQTKQMVDYAMAHGVNYFDTAWPYHGGKSELVMGELLSEYPREAYNLASKYPGHQISSSYNPAEIFEAQLKKCGVEYFDFYLLHNVYEKSIETYLDPKWGILDYFKEQKRLGRIRHLGFSSHGGTQLLEQFLKIAGEDMEFCQIQLNWLDWTLQDAKEKVALLNRYGVPVWVMEPVRGGRLCKLTDAQEAVLKALRPDESIPAWGFRFLQGIPGVTMVLSGMSNLAQMCANIETFERENPLKENELAALLEIAESMKDSVPCTGCRYCTDKCPMGLDIPMMLGVYNELRFADVVNASMRLEFLPEEKKPAACIGCGSCAAICPQSIAIPQVLTELSEKLKTMPKWADVCREREEAAKKLSEQK